MVKALVGLGNEGSEYERTYHNVGAFVASCLAEQAQGADIALRVYPVTGFMNVSGLPVMRWLKNNNINSGDFVLVHDDADLPVGGFKLSRGGGSAGHKGVESVAAALGTEDFWRLRVGVRDPREEVRKKAGEFVLSQWSAAEEQQFRAVAEQAWVELAKSL